MRDQVAEQGLFVGLGMFETGHADAEPGHAECLLLTADRFGQGFVFEFIADCCQGGRNHGFALSGQGRIELGHLTGDLGDAFVPVPFVTVDAVPLFENVTTAIEFIFWRGGVIAGGEIRFDGVTIDSAVSGASLFEIGGFRPGSCCPSS